MRYILLATNFKSMSNAVTKTDDLVLFNPANLNKLLHKLLLNCVLLLVAGEF